MTIRQRPSEQVFYFYLLESRLRRRVQVNRAPRLTTHLNRATFGNLARCLSPPQRMAVMARGDIVGGSKSTRKPHQANAQGVIVDNLSNRVGSAGQHEVAAPGNVVVSHSGAMSQQRCDSGTTSTPQQFVHLVGCRDRKAGRQQG